MPDDVLVGPATRLVLVEGLYLFLDTPPWAQLAEKALLDERWMMDVPPSVATRRIVARHLAGQTHGAWVHAQQSLDQTTTNRRRGFRESIRGLSIPKYAPVGR